VTAILGRQLRMVRSLRRFTSAPALAAWDVLLPLQRAWWALFGVPLLAVLHWMAGGLALFPVTLAIGPFGLAVIALTVLVRLVLLPMTAYQVRASLAGRRDAIVLRRRLAPAVAALRRRHRRRPEEFQRAIQALLREHGVDPLGGQGRTLRAGLLTAAVQAPLLIALYWVILAFAHGGGDLHFLWLANLAVPDPLLLPVVAGLTTYLVSRLATAAQAPPVVDNEQAATVGRLSAVVYPLVLAVSAHFAPAALVLYWVTGNLFAAGQQWLVNRAFVRPAEAAPGSL
jgi:YidC/Oxa1 family membrane protein insertase